MELSFPFQSSRPPEAASPAGTGEPPGGPDPAAPHDRRSRLARPDRGGDRVSRAQIKAEIASRAPRSRRRSRLARPNRGGDRVSVDRPDHVAAEIVSTAASAALCRVSTAQIPSDLGASALINRAARSSGSSSRFRRPFQRFSTAFSSQIQTDLGVSAPPGLPAPPPSLAGFPSALVRRRSSREGGNTAGACSA
ncbi:hypothetical protein VNO78_25964 [Psophocarpus tetragonolobus]|uniref:Uncharacterized protein n=1 Tax=Psophocarpus tetragonolobus TaxID=3891 RepID=A0AAN9S7D5_PSOTE